MIPQIHWTIEKYLEYLESNDSQNQFHKLENLEDYFEKKNYKNLDEIVPNLAQKPEIKDAIIIPSQAL